jgi:hypothetical protein
MKPNNLGSFNHRKGGEKAPIKSETGRRWIAMTILRAAFYCLFERGSKLTIRSSAHFQSELRWDFCAQILVTLRFFGIGQRKNFLDLIQKVVGKVECQSAMIGTEGK